MVTNISCIDQKNDKIMEIKMNKKIQLGCYYFPNYHEDSRNVIRHGPGWSEWDVVKHATPRFQGTINHGYQYGDTMMKRIQ